MLIDTILAVETSCDDTSVAIVDSTGKVLGMISASQDEVHEPFGGIVPEIAGRAHSEKLLPLIEQLFKKTQLNWSDISALAVTNRPGLVGSLLVGLVTVKTLALSLNKPFIGINHIEGHIWAPFVFDDPAEKNPLQQEFLSLVVSGGHTQLVHVEGVGKYKILGKTIDDAAGEAFDKFAKIIGLGYPGGYIIDQKSKMGNPLKYHFPRPMLKADNLDFSFSGLKTAAMNVVKDLSWEDVQAQTPDLCASYQSAIVDVLFSKMKSASESLPHLPISITGGVSANSQLREKIKIWSQTENKSCYFPKLKFCTDNAAMIGLAGILRMNLGEVSPQSLGPSPSSLKADFIL